MEYPNAIIKKGSKNSEAVKSIKKRLNELGASLKYNNPNFLDSTEREVFEFQKKNGLLSDGIVGKQTWNKLFEMADLYKDGKPSYQYLWDNLKIKTSREAAINDLVKRVNTFKPRYVGLLQIIRTPYPAASIPWQVIAVIHYMECSLSFKHHLHNGDPLTKRTVQVPKGRPAKGTPPFTWEQSAFDALCNVDGLHKVTDWSIPSLLYRLEAYNGLGYQKYHKDVLSPYLWAASEWYSKGKYAADGKWNANLVSQQVGAAVLLKQIM